ncbi:MAG: hypothetical protein ACC628_18620 [Pirellulaceae bacterium]
MMKWFRFLLLLCVVFGVGCGQAPSGSAGDANDPATDVDEVDEAAEAALGTEE